ncbi:hypothetical protein BHU72_04440 [Desulfuribacillus stibiiarsenatis]|uniref:ATPase AAA-type core domain-containing protein n=1 Tax=Desulfuribacillus stibiiarsenatis TaxID=1390249 RepID=A0A1E5L5C7_9FIRM|nr:AAA family ATPase [Desulfuribacillus stibiiarsenatis]OEH85347.1 hypothetical protein BHU72_04440 [Desulfuribacillus stibiiarsenatis]
MSLFTKYFQQRGWISILHQIEIKGYKSIRELQLELAPLTVLIGANGAGKSNLISFLQLIQMLTKRNLQQIVANCNGASHLLYFGNQKTSVLSSNLQFTQESGKIEYDFDLTCGLSDQLVFAKERISLNSGVHSLGTGHTETKLDSFSHEQIHPFLEYVNSWEFYRFHHAPDLSIVSKLHSIYLNEPSHYKRILHTLQQMLPFFDDFVWSDPSVFYWREKGSDMVFNTSHLSDGMVRMITLVTILLQPNPPALLCIDEPELGLHPYAINVLACIIKSLATETQLIISTQSITLLNHLEVEDVVVVDRKNGQSTFQRLQHQSLAKWLEDYTLGELWEKNIIGGRPSL